MNLNRTVTLPTFHVSAIKRVYFGGRWRAPNETFWITASDLRWLGQRVEVLRHISERDVQSRIDLTRKRLQL